jgi:membrane-associated protein
MAEWSIAAVLKTVEGKPSQGSNPCLSARILPSSFKILSLLMDYLHQLFSTLLHIDVYLNQFVTSYGFLTYLALFLVIFCETGLVITPFLPGDSLLFAAGSLAAQANNSINIVILFFLLFIASLLGNQINYLIGKAIGPRIFTAKSSWLLNKRYLEETHQFYEKHGGKTIILARFIPIIRTFAPFIAGIGAMYWLQFSFYNVISALLWIGSLLGLGYFLGSLPLIKDNFTCVVYGIVLISLLPTLIAFIKKA